MLTISILLLFIGFYLWYLTSSKIHLNLDNNIIFIIQKNKLLVKTASGILISLFFILQAVLYGTATGCFFGIVLFMTIGSLVIILNPLQHFNYKLVIACFLIAIFLENLIF